ncbi:hypothetical protein KQI52_05950 [bacterium]|nr:hypothetical protein [bacterium]
MPSNTLVSHINQITIAAPYSDPLIDVAQITHTIPIEHASGFYSVVLKTFTHVPESSTRFQNINHLYFLWRQILPGVETRWHPMYIDLEADPPATVPPSRGDAEEYGRPPDFAIAANLVSQGADPKFAANRIYNLYFVRPNVPESVPLLQDPPNGPHSGIEIMVQLIGDQGVDQSQFTYEMWVFATVLS